MIAGDAPGSRRPPRAALWLARAQAGSGIFLALLGALGNPPLVERYVLLDHRLTNPLPLLAAELALVGAGVWLLLLARRTRRAEAHVQGKTIAFACAAVVAASALSLALAEIAARALLDPARVLRGDAWWEHRWRLSHGPGAGGAAAQGEYAFDEYDPELGWRPKARHRSAEVTTNELGIRSDREVALERAPGVARIVLVGDSYTWGENVTNGECFPARLEALMPGVETLNLGVHGYGTDQQLFYLRRLGFSLSPDLVILGFFEDDINRNVLTFRDYAKPRFLIDADRLVTANVPVSPPESLLARPQRMPKSYIAELALGALDRILDRTVLRRPERGDRWRITRAILEAARRETEAGGARFLLVYMPVAVTPEPHGAEPILAAWAESTGTEMLNLREAFLRLPPEERGALYGATHWTPEGNARAAEAVRDAILSRGLLPPRQHSPPAPPPSPGRGSAS